MGEFETIFIGAKSNNLRFLLERSIEFLVQTQVNLLERYHHILEQLESEKCDGYLGTYQTFDNAKINTNKPTTKLFQPFFLKVMSQQ